MGLYAANTMGDGNCLFRALSDQLYGYPHQHAVLRETVCDYLAAKSEKFAAFIDVEKPFEEYVRTMRQSGTYGGHLELSAFAQLQQKEIKIVQPGLVYIVSGDDESPQATRTREKRELERRAAQDKTVPGTEGPPPSERELRRLRREKKLKGLDEDGPSGSAALESAGESSKMALQEGASDAHDPQDGPVQDLATAEAFGPLYIAYHSWEHYSSVRNLEGPHTGLPRIKEVSIERIGCDQKSMVADRSLCASQIHTASLKEDNSLSVEEEHENTEPTEEESLVLRSTQGYSLQQVRFYISQHGGWEEALEAIQAQEAVDDDETEDEDEDDTLSTTCLTNLSSPDDAARADEAAGPSQSSPPASQLDEQQQDYYGHVPLPDHLRDWRAASPSSVDTTGTLSSLEGGSTSTHATTTDDSPEAVTISSHMTKRAGALHEAKRSKRAASKDPMASLRSPKRRSRSRSPIQPQSGNTVDEGTLAAQGIDALHVRGTPVESEVEGHARNRAPSTRALTMRERRQARLEEKARKAIEARNKRRERATGEEENREPSSQASSHVRGFLELKI